MKTFDLIIRPVHSALLMGGQTDPAFGGHKATARTHEGSLVIPGTALRGALRIELERLLRGRDGIGSVCSANREAATPDEDPCACAVCRLFGEPGTVTGTLRLGDGHFESEISASRNFAVRPQVAVSRKTGSAAEGHLVFNETSPTYGAHRGATEVCFRARVELVPRLGCSGGDHLEEDLDNLRAACRALRAVGAGKARGLGWVECELESPVPEKPAENRVEISKGATALAVHFHAREPLHLAEGRPEGFYHATRRKAPASTVRGALAFALLEQGLAKPEDPGFQQLFVGPEAAHFGIAWPVLEGEVFRPALTFQRCRGVETHTFDDLVPALLVRRAAQEGLALAETRVCATAGCTAHKSDAAPAPKLPVRTRTRMALNRQTGTAMDAKLYSQEALEPPLTLAAEVHGLSPAALELLTSLHGRRARLGGKRSKGFGLCEVELRALGRQRRGPAMTKVRELQEALEGGWEDLARYAPAELRDGFPKTFLETDHLPLAIQLLEPWYETGQKSQAEQEVLLREGPLGQKTEASKGTTRLLGAFIRFESQGRFPSVEGERHGARKAGEADLIEAAAAGSVYVYSVHRRDLKSHLYDWLQQGAAGSGSFGWGRFVVRGAGLRDNNKSSR